MQRSPYLTATVYFAEASRPRSALRRCIRVAHRRPDIVAAWAKTATIRMLTGSRVTHCAVSVGGVVLEPCYTGTAFWITAQYVDSRPGLVAACRVPLTRSPDLDAWATPHRRSVVRAFMRWATCGFVRGDDCVSTVRAVLAAGGFPSPEWAVTPLEFFNYLKGHPDVRHIALGAVR